MANNNLKEVATNNLNEVANNNLEDNIPYDPDATSCGHPMNSTEESILIADANRYIDNFILQMAEASSMLNMSMTEYMEKFNIAMNYSRAKNEPIDGKESIENLRVIAAYVNSQIPKNERLRYQSHNYEN